MSFIFKGESRVHCLPWTELLSMEEIPFEGYSDVTEGLQVMAPWTSGEKSSLQYSEASITATKRKFMTAVKACIEYFTSL